MREGRTDAPFAGNQHISGCGRKVSVVRLLRRSAAWRNATAGPPHQGQRYSSQAGFIPTPSRRDSRVSRPASSVTIVASLTFGPCPDARRSTARLEICRLPLSLLGTEPWCAGLKFLTFKVNGVRPGKRMLPGDEHPVIIYPGLATDSSAIAPLRDYCESLGYKTLDWGRASTPVPGATWTAGCRNWPLTRPTFLVTIMARQPRLAGAWAACMRAKSESCWRRRCVRSSPSAPRSMPM